MITYVESNFILEVALFQEESREANQILELAEQKRIELVFPTFSLSEPFSTITFRDINRKRLAEEMRRETDQLGRSRGKEGVASDLGEAAITLLEVTRTQTNNVESTEKRMLEAGRLIPLDKAIFQRGLDFEKDYGLDPKDAIIYASIISDLEPRPNEIEKCFVTRDRKLWVPGMKSEMSRLRCSVLFSFRDALDFITNKLAAQPSHPAIH